jgi:hypothetical protein
MKGSIDLRDRAIRLRVVAVTATAVLASGAGSLAATLGASPVKGQTAGPASSPGDCTTVTCHFTLAVNPGLTAGHPFACPAIQNAVASITVTNRFARGDQDNDKLTLTASGLPPNTGFDLFLVEHSPFDVGFAGFGFGWYQSDLESDSSGNASVNVRGIFDVETFIVQPGSPTPVHTYNVGFWFNSPEDEASVCASPIPAPTPFNGEQNAGLLAMITSGAPLSTVH